MYSILLCDYPPGEFLTHTVRIGTKEFCLVDFLKLQNGELRHEYDGSRITASYADFKDEEDMLYFKLKFK